MATATNVQSENGAGVARLVGGIVQDAQDLIKQQLTLFQVEMKNDLRRTRDASIPLVIGAIVALISGILLGAMVAHLLHEVAHLPLWGGFAIAGGGFALVSGTLIVWGKSKLDSFNPLPEKAVECLKENIQWKTRI